MHPEFDCICPRRHARATTYAFALIAPLALVMTLSAFAQRDDGQPDLPPVQISTSGGAVTKPTDPNAVKGTWTIGGRTHSITAGDFYATHVLLSRIEGTPQLTVTPARTWEYILAVDEADVLGIVVLDEEIDHDLQKFDADVYAGILDRWQALQVAESDGRAYTRNIRKAAKVRDLFLNTQRLTTQEAFDLYKAGRQKYKLEYMQFAADDYRTDDEIDDATLRTFWSDNKIVQQQYRTQNTVSAEIVYLDSTDIDLAELQRFAGGKEVTREEALEQFNRNREFWMTQIPPDKQHLLHIEAGADPKDIVSPFQVLEDVIRRAVVVEEVLRQAHNKALAGGANADFKAIAAEGRLGYEIVEKIDRPTSIATLRRFGFNAFNAMFAAEEKQVTTQLYDEQNVRYFFRLNAKAISQLPEYETIRDQLRETYIVQKSTDRARRDSQEAITWINAQINQHIQPMQDRLTKNAEAEAARRVKEMGLVKEEDIQRERTRAMSTLRQPIDEERRRLRPQLFDTYVKEKGIELHATDFFEFQPQRADRSKVMDVAESRLTFLQTNYYVQPLSEGDVTPTVLEDPVTKTFFIARLAAKKDPEIGTMTAVDFAQARAQLRQRKDNSFLLRWRYSEIAKRFQLEVK